MIASLDGGIVLPRSGHTNKFALTVEKPSYIPAGNHLIITIRGKSKRPRLSEAACNSWGVMSMWLIPDVNPDHPEVVQSEVNVVAVFAVA